MGQEIKFLRLKVTELFKYEEENPKLQLQSHEETIINEIKKFAQKAMGTTDVRVEVKLNKYIWSRGIRSVPSRVRFKLPGRETMTKMLRKNSTRLSLLQRSQQKV